MRRIAAFFLALLCVAGLGTPRAEAAEMVRTGQGHTDMLTALCEGFPYVGYEKYPQLPYLFQQDYAHVSYGGGKWTLDIVGCGILCLSMVSTYLTDELHTPEELAVQFASYGNAGGTAFSLFDDSPAVLGFRLVEKTWDRKKVVSALEAGHLVVSIQRGGIFTTTGHFIVLSGITPEGKILVHDPNRDNHQGHERFYDGFTNGFRQESIFTGGLYYWIMGKKLVRVPGCSRCSDPEVETAVLWQGERYCRRCTDLKTRQAAFRNALSAHRVEPEI